MKKQKIKEKLLQRAFELFTQEMYERLREKEEDGYTGWGKESDIPRNDIIQRASQKLTYCALHKRNTHQDDVDIANFMMMLWYRNSGYRILRRELKEKSVAVTQ